jgi:hypothetical protein
VAAPMDPIIVLYKIKLYKKLLNRYQNNFTIVENISANNQLNCLKNISSQYKILSSSG